MNFLQLLNIEPHILQEIEKETYAREIAKNDFFAKEGTISDEIGIVLEGVLRVYFLNKDGEELNLKFICPGEVFMADYVPNHRALFHIQAITDTRLDCITFHKFERLEKKWFELFQLRNLILSQKIRQANLREVRLRSQNATERYLHFLTDYPNLIDTIPHYHIANYLNISSTQLSRIRAKLG